MYIPRPTFRMLCPVGCDTDTFQRMIHDIEIIHDRSIGGFSTQYLHTFRVVIDHIFR